MWRFEVVTSLVSEIRAESSPSTKIHLIDLKNGWLGGCDVGAIAGVCDGALICGYDMAPKDVSELLVNGRRMIGERHLGTGFRVFYPEMGQAGDLAARAVAAAEAGA